MKSCYLCTQTKPLSTRSHIIPRFMYEGMFIKNEPLYISPINVTSENKRLVKKSMIGEYEANILCFDCEQKILGHYYDDYVATIFNGNSAAYDTSIKFENFSSELGFDYVNISNIDEERFRVFLLSVLFRVGISQRDLFKDIRLDSALQEKIRNSIYNKQTVNDLNVYINILCYRHLNLDFGKIIVMPATGKLGANVIVYSLLINGYIYLFYLTEHANDLSKRIQSLSKQNIKIHMLRKNEAIKLIFAHFGIKAL